jgi:acyl-CoA thioester hydrolase
MEPSKYLHALEFEVRDYECDLQGVVNNANYQHYIEHARHKWLEFIGIDFAALHKDGIDLIVVRMEMDYKYPLRSRDRFVVRSNLEREGRLKLICKQDIHRLPDEKLIAQARVVVTGLQNGRPTIPDAVAQAIEKVIKTE